VAQHSDIRDRILDDIVSGTFPSGTRLTIDELATRYGASHMPVREALRSLQGADLLEMGSGRSARVRDFDAAFVENLFATHVALQVMLIRKAAQNCAPRQLRELEEIEAALEACLAAGDYDGELLQNRRFHRAINEIADNPDAMAIIDRHWVVITSLWRRVGYGPARFDAVVSDHRHMIRALSRRDAEAAGLLMGAHVIKAKFELYEQMAAFTARQGPGPIA
jgi:DNA-binding GntR family transcriptional regulator